MMSEQQQNLVSPANQEQAAAVAGAAYAGLDPQTRSMMEEKDRQIKQMGARILDLESKVREPNYPPCLPIVHHIIAKDIPDRRQKYMKAMFFNYHFTALLLVLNMIFSFIVAAGELKEDMDSDNNDDFKKGQWVSLAYLLGIVLAFAMWYWPIYRSVGTGMTSKYVMSLFGVGLSALGGIWSCIGVPGYGALGFLCMTKAFADKSSDTPGYLALTTTIMWFMSTGMLIFGFVWQIRYYRKDKASMRSAKADASNVITSAI